MEYAIEILNQHLLNETQARAEAIEYLDGGVVSPMSGTENATRDAFLESKRLAEIRIPQLVSAIAKINASDHP